jgi:hypothetical protein
MWIRKILSFYFLLSWSGVWAYGDSGETSSIPIPVYQYFSTGVKSIYTDAPNRLIMGLTVTAALVAHSYDSAVKDYAQTHGLMSKDLSRFGDLYGGRYAHWVLFSGLFADGLARSVPRPELKRQFTYAFSAMAVNGVITAGLKVAVGRKRPNGRGYRSFPSGHTSHSFTVATIAEEIWGPSVGVPAYLIGGLVALQRIHDNKHYLSDVIAGAGLGTVVGRGFAYAYRMKDLHWFVSPLPDGVMIVYRF